jgi:hypothetical protein
LATWDFVAVRPFDGVDPAASVGSEQTSADRPTYYSRAKVP